MIITRSPFLRETTRLDSSPPKLFSLQGPRPDFVIKRIDDSFSYAKTLSKENYTKTGESVYSFSSGFTSDDLLEKCLGNRQDKKMSVLDVGTGSGMFVKTLSDKHPDFTVIGISASDMRREVDLPDEKYILANAETLLESGVFSRSSFDLIVSSFTFMHFVDPLRTLADLYELLSPHGVICIDLFTARGLEGSIDKWVDYLHQNGYLVAVEYSEKQRKNGECEFLLIQKTHPTLDLACLYDTDDPMSAGPVLYKIDQAKMPGIERQHYIHNERRFGAVDLIVEQDLESEIKLPPGWGGILEPEIRGFFEKA